MRDKLRKTRSDLKKTLDDMAELTGLSKSGLSKIERNPSQMRPSSMARIAAGYGLTPAEILEIATQGDNQ